MRQGLFVAIYTGEASDDSKSVLGGVSMFSNSMGMMISFTVFALVLFSSQAHAAFYQVNCSQTNAATVTVGGDIRVSSQMTPPLSQQSQEDIVKLALPACHELVQEQVDELSCSVLAVGSLFAFQVGYFANATSSSFAFYNEGYLSSTNFSSYGFVRKNSCP